MRLVPCYCITNVLDPYMKSSVQRYDTDPAAKAAAATVLASKLGADSGLKVYVGDETKHNASIGKSNDVEITKSTGLRNRKSSLSGDSKTQNTSIQHPEGVLNQMGFEGADMSQQRQMVVEHHRPQAGLSAHNGGWIARLAALLVGEDPTQSYALICGNCHMHNGLARKEDFPYITYYCPHCNALNRPKQLDDRVSGSNSPTTTTLATMEDALVVASPGGSTVDMVPSPVGSTGDKVSVSGSPVAAASAERTSES